MAHFHWSWDYLNWGISWSIVQRMMADQPDYSGKSSQESDHENMQEKINAIKRG